MSLKICSVGDIMLGENVHHFRRGIATRYCGNFRRLIPPEVLTVFNDADLVTGNLECSLMPDAAHRNAPLSRAMYAAPESALDCFAGCRPPLVLNVANNHFGQHGRAATDFTIRRLAGRGIHCVGHESSPLELTVRGKRVCIWGVSLVEDRGTGYVKSTPDSLLQDLDWGKKTDNTLWVLSIHWGTEYRTQPSRVQVALAERLAQHGVDLVLGHHPHVIQPVGETGAVPVAYSHGNFLFDQNFSNLTRTGLMLSIEPGTGQIRCYELHSREYRIRSCREISRRELDTFCRRRCHRYTSPLMRILMKLEMLSRGYEVPGAVWAHFFSRLTAKICRN